MSKDANVEATSDLPGEFSRVLARITEFAPPGWWDRPEDGGRVREELRRRAADRGCLVQLDAELDVLHTVY